MNFNFCFNSRIIGFFVMCNKRKYFDADWEKDGDHIEGAGIMGSRGAHVSQEIMSVL